MAGGEIRDSKFFLAGRIASRFSVGVQKQEQDARNVLAALRSLGFPFIDLRSDGDWYFFFCILCDKKCYSLLKVWEHFQEENHVEMLRSSTVFCHNPFPFDDGVHFFHNNYIGVPSLTLAPRLIGYANIEAQFFLNKISRIWTSWFGLGTENPKAESEYFEFAILTFSYNYALGLEFIGSSNDVNGAKKKGKMPLAEPKQDQMKSNIPIKCALCEKEILPSKDVSTLLHTKTRTLVCSSSNERGMFHTLHTSCLVRWILFCLVKKFTLQISDLRSEMETKDVNIHDYDLVYDSTKGLPAAFCIECQGNVPSAHDQIIKDKAHVDEAYKAWIEDPEMGNPGDSNSCSTGLRFPIGEDQAMNNPGDSYIYSGMNNQDEEDTGTEGAFCYAGEEVQIHLRILKFYRVEEHFIPTSLHTP